MSLGTEWSFGTGSYGLPPGTINDAADIFAQAIRYERVEDYDAASGQASVTIAPGSRFNLRGWVYRNTQREDRSRYDDGTYSSMDDPLVQGTFQSHERTTVTGSTALARIGLQRFGWLRLAVNQRREAFDANGTIRDVSAGGGGGAVAVAAAAAVVVGEVAAAVRPRSTSASFTLDQHVDVYSTGAEWQFRPASKLGAVLGSSVNWQQRPGADTDTEPTWLAGLSYDATPELRLHASATRKIRVPSIDQLYSTTAGNPALRAERAYGVDVGADQQVGRVSTVGISAFVIQAHDFIERISGSPFENQDRYRFAGTEVTLQTAAIERVNLRGAYTFLDSVDVTPDAANRRLQTRPRHRGTVEAMWTPVTGSAVRGAAQFVGSQLFDSRGSNPVQVPADGYALLDLGFTQALTRRFELAFDVTNVFDQLYDQGYGLPREGRAAVLTLRVRGQ